LTLAQSRFLLNPGIDGEGWDTAISVHFWLGRGLNTGIASAASLVATVTGAWRKRSFREADFAPFEARMAQLQFRNQTRGFYGSMRVDDTTGDVTPIRDFISRSYQDGAPTRAQHQENCAVLSDRLSVFYKSLRGRLPASSRDPQCTTPVPTRCDGLGRTARASMTRLGESLISMRRWRHLVYGVE
jgi:hypothetical protein